MSKPLGHDEMKDIEQSMFVTQAELMSSSL